VTTRAAARVQPLRVIQTPKPVLRRTEVQNLLSCTEWESGSSEAAAFGSAFHEAVAQYLLVCQTHREETRVADVEDIARDAFFRVARGLDPARLDEFRTLVDQFARSHVAGLSTLMSIERTLTADVGFAVLTGTLDRLDRLDDGETCEPPTDILITDWKTSWGVEDHAFQLRFYGALVCLTWPTVEHVHTRADHVRAQNGIVEAEYARAELLGFWEDVLRGLRARLTGPTGTATGGTACRYCGKRRTCGAAVGSCRAVPDSADSARRLFGDLMRLEAAVDEARSSLKRYFAEREPALWDGTEVGFLPPREPSWRVTDPQGVQTFLRTRGLDAKLGLDGRQVPEALKRELVDAGLARYEPGRVEFRVRNATGSR
jgi:hypothetical protein